MKISAMLVEANSVMDVKPSAKEIAQYGYTEAMKRLKSGYSTAKEYANKGIDSSKEYVDKAIKSGKESMGGVTKFAKTANEWTPTSVKVGLPLAGVAALGAGLAAKRLRKNK